MANEIICPERAEVQAHGFTWERESLIKIYGATEEGLAAIGYTNKIDLPSHLNRLDPCSLSVKTTGKPNAVGMADCLRVFDSVSSGEPIHMTVIHYKQNDATKTKRIVSITEVDLTDSCALLFGTLVRSQIEDLVKAIRLVPQNRGPTPEEYVHMYSIRDSLQALSDAIHLDIKCNRDQSRLQCSFNQFQTFLKKNPDRIIATSDSNEFRGGRITAEILSARRVFKKKN
jgi:hypothetical protein